MMPFMEWEPPANLSLWRYMRVEKFERMIRDSTLWFSRADQFKDKLEGSISKEQLEDEYAWNPTIMPDVSFFRSLQPQFTYVSCWRVSEEESNVMWEAYGDIAIQTRWYRLGSQIPANVHVIQVDYDGGASKWSLEAPFHKKLSAFRDEKELRLLVNWFLETPKKPDGTPAVDRPGLPLRIHDLDLLIERIVLGPGCGRDQRRRVEEFLSKTQPKLLDRLHDSVLSSAPSY